MGEVKPTVGIRSKIQLGSCTTTYVTLKWSISQEDTLTHGYDILLK